MKDAEVEEYRKYMIMRKVSVQTSDGYTPIIILRLQFV